MIVFRHSTPLFIRLLIRTHGIYFLIAEGKIDNAIYSDFMPLHSPWVAIAMYRFSRLNFYYFLITQTGEISI